MVCEVLIAKKTGKVLIQNSDYGIWYSRPMVNRESLTISQGKGIMSGGNFSSNSVCDKLKWGKRRSLVKLLQLSSSKMAVKNLNDVNSRSNIVIEVAILNLGVPSPKSLVRSYALLEVELMIDYLV